MAWGLAKNAQWPALRNVQRAKMTKGTKQANAPHKPKEVGPWLKETPPPELSDQFLLQRVQLPPSFTTAAPKRVVSPPGGQVTSPKGI